MGEDGEVIGVEMFHAADDSIARARADQIVARVGYRAVEVWECTVMIYRAERQSEHPSTTSPKHPVKPH